MFLVFTSIIVSLFSAHHICKLSKMFSLRSLSVVDRKQIEEVILEKLKRGESTRVLHKTYNYPKVELHNFVSNI